MDIFNLYNTLITSNLSSSSYYPPKEPELIIKQTTSGTYTFSIITEYTYDFGMASGGASGGGQKSGSTSKGTGGASGVALKGKIKLPVGNYKIVVGKQGSAYTTGNGQNGGDTVLYFVTDSDLEILRLTNSSYQKGAAGDITTYGNNDSYTVKNNLSSIGASLVESNFTWDNYHSSIYSNSPNTGGYDQEIGPSIMVAGGGSGFVYSDKTPATNGKDGGIYIYG